MRRSLTLLVIPFALSLSSARAQDAITPETVVAVKHATVFIRVEGASWKGSGSGFVIAAEKGSALVATNCHVLAGPEFDKARLGPAAMLKSVSSNKVTAIFDGGTRAELSLKAEVLAADQERDLAVIRVSGLKSPPAPIPYATAPAPVETQAIVAFGYPLGDALATGKGAPAVTVSKGSVSSLRMDDDGELAKVQIDAAINPGNSGGPVVDAKGRLVGVVVSGFRGAQGLNFAIPAAEVTKMMKGRLDGVTATATKAADGSVAVRTEVGVIDPSAALRRAALRYVVIPPKGEKPKPGEALDKVAGTKVTALEIRGGVATAELKLDKAEGDLFVQAVPDGGAAGATRVQHFALAIPKGATGAVALSESGALGGPGAGETDPPAGWKVYTATNRTYKVWLPEKCNVSQKQRSSGRPGQRITFNSVLVEVPGGKLYVIEQVTLFPPPRAGEAAELIKLLRDLALGDAPGAKVVRESDAKMGRFSGKEFVIEKGAAATRARAFVIGSSVYFLRVMGSRAQVDAEDSTVFLESCRLQVPNPKVPNPPNPGGQPGNQAGGIAAGTAGGTANDAPFTDRVPAGGALVGLEVRLGKVGDAVAFHSVRPIYLVGEDKVSGKWYGPTDTKNVTESFKVVGRSGYAVGGLTVKPGPAGVLGVSIRFMKAAGGRLDPKDNYDTPWIGTKDGPGAAPVTLGGKGDRATGLIGKTTPQGVSGVGLLYPDLEKKPNPPAVVQQPGGGPKVISGGKEPFILGSIEHDPKFKTVGPAGAILVGLEARFGKFGNTDIVRAVRPIYRVNGKEQFGQQFGNNLTGSVTLKAKDGYAVGAITGKAGWWCNGFSLTFMKVKSDGTLDPKDKYESEWVGFNGQGEVTAVTGDGAPAVGIVGKIVGTETTALGLLFKGQESYDPGNAVRPGVPQPPRPGQPGTRGPRVVGRGDQESRDGAPEGGLLVGLEFGMGKFANRDVVKAVRPVYRAGDKESHGDWYGAEPAAPVKVVAKPGYAVGAASVRTTLGIQGVSLTFMKVKADGKLDPTESYQCDWVGSPPQIGTRVGGDGTAVVGVVVLGNDREATGLGLIYSDASKQDGVWAKGTPSRIQGGFRDPEFRDGGPAGSLLVGVEVGVGRFVNNKVVKSVRPIFRAKDKDAEGEWHGPTDANTVNEVQKAVAKPGYAVGAITVKNGRGIDGLSVTFMKVKADGTLDATDSYESEWIGGMGGGPAQKVDGGGKPVIGLIGKTRPDCVCGLGLLHPKK